MNIVASIQISNAGILVNNQVWNNGHELNTSSDVTEVYKELGLSYPKFHKMDLLCKTGFLAVELLKTQVDFSLFADDAIALVFQNSVSSLDTDLKHQENISSPNLTASPATFVYTLPNIVLGEIAIRNKFYGENIFTLASSFSMTNFENLVEVLFASNKAQAVIGGWLEVINHQINAHIYFVTKD